MPDPAEILENVDALFTPIRRKIDAEEVLCGGVFGGVALVRLHVLRARVVPVEVWAGLFGRCWWLMALLERRAELGW